jgi:hypothetical protein
MTAKMQPFWYFKKPVISCPEGEQITNGDFETGDPTGWTLSTGNIQTDVVHSGIYAARIYPSGPRLLSQTLVTPVPVICVKSFDLYYLQNMDSSYAKVIYDDDSYSESYLSATGLWIQLNLKDILTAGKTISKLELHNGYMGHLYIDDVSLISGAP